MFLYHFLILNLGGLYYICNGIYDVRTKMHSNKLNDYRVKDRPSVEVTYPITICLDERGGPLSGVIKEGFDIIKDRFKLITKLPEGDEYEIISIYGEPCDTNTATDNPEKVCPFVRDLFLSRIPNISMPRKKYFIRRKESNASHAPNSASDHKIYIRTILNEEEFVERLKAYNIESIYLEEYSLEEKVKLFNSASMVISTHSSALTCILFCSSDVKVVEILNTSSNYGFGVHYKILCNTLGLSYYRYSNVIEDENGNFRIENDSDIFKYIQDISDS